MNEKPSPSEGAKPSDERLSFGANYYDTLTEEKEQRAEKILTDLKVTQYEIDELIEEAELDDLLNDMLGPVRYED